jgi:urease gamma subunit
MESGCQVLTRSDVLDGLPEILKEVRVEATFPDGLVIGPTTVTASAWHLARMHEDS